MNALMIIIIMFVYNIFRKKNNINIEHRDSLVILREISGNNRQGFKLVELIPVKQLST